MDAVEKGDATYVGADPPPSAAVLGTRPARRASPLGACAVDRKLRDMGAIHPLIDGGRNVTGAGWAVLSPRGASSCRATRPIRVPTGTRQQEQEQAQENEQEQENKQEQ